MTPETPCTRRECDWRPRVDRGALTEKAQVEIIQLVADGALDDDELDALIGRLSPLTYVRDICATCGTTRERS